MLVWLELSRCALTHEDSAFPSLFPDLLQTGFKIESQVPIYAAKLNQRSAHLVFVAS
jgi:hypothetical protein